MTKPLTELFESKVAYARETLLEAEKIAYRKNARDYAESCFQFGGDPELRDPWFHGVGFDAGSEKESNRRKPIDLATKKLIEALEFYAGNFDGKDGTVWNRDTFFIEDKFGLTHTAGGQTKAREALAEFRESLEDGE